MIMDKRQKELLTSSTLFEHVTILPTTSRLTACKGSLITVGGSGMPALLAPSPVKMSEEFVSDEERIMQPKDGESDCGSYDTNSASVDSLSTSSSPLANPADESMAQALLSNSSSSGSIRGEWNARSSFMAKNTVNPIRNIVDGLRLTPNPNKPMIALSIGDPTTYGNFSPPTEAAEAVIAAIRSQKYDGYCPSTGILSAREAVAKYTSRPESSITAKDVILTSGASHALEMCIAVMCDRGSNLLIPCPGFSIYKTIACSLGVECRSYQLQPESDWEVDLDHLASLIDSDTAAIIINNPSNPCGSVYSKEHLRDVLELADFFKVPIIADEIYDDLVFPGHTFYPLATLTSSVPILSCNGLTKKFICPGWRMGWITIHDRNNIFDTEIRPGLTSLSQRILGPNAPIQGALPTILTTVPKSYFHNIIQTIFVNAKLAFDGLSSVAGLTPIMPAGAMYMMTRVDMSCFPNIPGDLAFTSQLVGEESVFCLPGQCFDFANYFRIVLTVPEEKMKEAVSRIAAFCQRHYVPVDGDERIELAGFEEDAVPAQHKNNNII